MYVGPKVHTKESATAYAETITLKWFECIGFGMRRGVFFCLYMLGFVRNGEGVDRLYLLFMYLLNPYDFFLGGYRFGSF